MEQRGSDRFDVDRFVRAQESGGTYHQVLAELRSGRKRGHWMWFVFPQVEGLGRSATARHYAISGLEEAQAYLAHPLLGPRLLECARALVDLPGDCSAEDVLGGIDAAKLRSSMTLFLRAAPDEADARTLVAVLQRWFDGDEDSATHDLLP